MKHSPAQHTSPPRSPFDLSPATSYPVSQVSRLYRHCSRAPPHRHFSRAPPHRHFSRAPPHRHFDRAKRVEKSIQTAKFHFPYSRPIHKTRSGGPLKKFKFTTKGGTVKLVWPCAQTPVHPKGWHGQTCLAVSRHRESGFVPLAGHCYRVFQQPLRSLFCTGREVAESQAESLRIDTGLLAFFL